MNPIIGHGLANGALLGGAMALSGAGSLAATIIANVLFLAFVLSVTVSTLALVADHWAMKTNNPPAVKVMEPSARRRETRGLAPASPG